MQPEVGFYEVDISKILHKINEPLKLADMLQIWLEQPTPVT